MNVRLTAAMAAAVLAIWLVGTWVTKYSLGEMAVLAPIAVLVVGATLGLVIVWVKIALDSWRGRGSGQSS